MKRLFGLIITGAVILAVGMALGGGMVASAAEAPLVDGQSQPAQDASISDPAGPSAPLAGATLYRMYAANEFHSTHSDLTYASYGPAIYALAIPGGGFSFKLPLDLPNAAQVTRITIYLVDNDDTHNMSMQFYRVKLSNATQIELDSVSTVSLPSSSAVQTVTMTGAPITITDSTQYAYCIRYAPVIIGNLHQMVGVRVEYTAPSGYLTFIRK
jgi:hypothetical protein